MKKNFLPKLDAESCEQALEETNAKDFVKNQKSKIRKENNFFYRYITALSKNLKSRDAMDLIVSIYNFIKIQADSDKTKIPIVSEEIAGPIQVKLKSLGDDEFMTKTLKIIKIENPIIYSVIKDYCKSFDDDNETIKYISVLAYEMMRNQAEADYMNAEIKLI